MKPLLTCALALVLSAPSLAACTRARHADRAEPPVVIIGVDGLEWSVVLDMLHEKRLPNLARMLEQGVFGRLRVTKPTLSPIIWTSIATGVTAARHGIRGFVHPESAQTKPVLYASTDRRKKALWNVTSEAGLSTWVVGWWLTYPVEPINGVMVAQVNTVTPAMRRAGKGVWKGSLVAGLEGQVHPRSLEPQVLDVVNDIDAAVDELRARLFAAPTDELGEVPRRLLEQSGWALRADALYRRIVLDLLRDQAAPAFLAVYFGGADVIGHRFWRYLHPELYDHPPTAAEVDALAGVVPAYYDWLDEVVGEIRETLPGASVIVVSDHGMDATNRAAKYLRDTLSGGHLGAPPAFFAAAGARIRNAGNDDVSALRSDDVPTLGSILDVAPTALALLGLPVGRDMQGGVVRDVIDAAHLAAHPLTVVDRHTEPGWRPATVQAEISDAEERLEQLRALGYLERR